MESMSRASGLGFRARSYKVQGIGLTGRGLGKHEHARGSSFFGSLNP